MEFAPPLTEAYDKDIVEARAEAVEQERRRLREQAQLTGSGEVVRWLAAVLEREGR